MSTLISIDRLNREVQDIHDGLGGHLSYIEWLRFRRSHKLYYARPTDGRLRGPITYAVLYARAYNVPTYWYSM